MNPANHDLRAWMGEVESINQLHMGGLVEMILERSKHSPGERKGRVFQTWKK